MTTEILNDNRFSTQTSFVLWSIFPIYFCYNEDGKVIEKRSDISHKKAKLGRAKKEIEALGGYLNFIPRGSHHIEILYKIPK